MMENIVSRISAHKPASPSIAACSLDNIEAGSLRQSQRCYNIESYDNVISGERQGRLNQAAFDPGVLAANDPRAIYPRIDDNAHALFRVTHIGANKGPTAVD